MARRFKGKEIAVLSTEITQRSSREQRDGLRDRPALFEREREREREIEIEIEIERERERVLP